MADLTLSVVIPTYRREQVLTETVAHVLVEAEKTPGFLEIIVVDQSPSHEPETDRRLSGWSEKGAITWLRLDMPGITRSMNIGLAKAVGDIVLFLDDDIIPAPGFLKKHLEAHQARPEAWGVVGQILQPGEESEDVPFTPHGGALSRYLDFPFRRNAGMYIEQAMAGNLSVKKEKALEIGGFDENFTPPVAYRFETEFAKRLIACGGKIWFEPEASIRHLRAKSGGTRTAGDHLKSISPAHGVGDYYYALRIGKGWERIGYIAKRPFRSVRTQYHLTHPWWIPVKFTGELLAIGQAIGIYCRGPRLLGSKGRGDCERYSSRALP
jgi:GT2 family glycosyltransferase